jgi:hypothetical protein
MADARAQIVSNGVVLSERGSVVDKTGGSSLGRLSSGFGQALEFYKQASTAGRGGEAAKERIRLMERILELQK